MRSSAGSRSILAAIYSKKKPYHTHLKAAKATMLRRLARWLSYRNFRPKQIKQYFDLEYVFRMLNTIFFGGLLHDRVELKWKSPVGKLDYLSRNKPIFDDRRGLRAEIEIVKPLTNGPWTPAMMLERYNALLYGMTWAFFEIYCHNCVLFQQSNNRAARGRRSGYGSPFERFLQEVKQEANRISKGFPRPWDFHIWHLCSCKTFDIGLSILQREETINPNFGPRVTNWIIVGLTSFANQKEQWSNVVILISGRTKNDLIGDHAIGTNYPKI